MNATFSIAFLAGLISFLSPCVLPLIPGYISYISGTSLEKLVEKKNNLVIIKTIFFTLGFSVIFIILGSAASFLGKFFLNNSNILRIVAGIFIIFFSLQIIGIINLKFMNKEMRFFTNQYSNNLTFPFLVGAAFGFGWTPLLVVVAVGSLYVIYTYYLTTFHPFNLEPKEKGYTLSHFIGYIYTGKKQSWISLFYKFPKDLKRLNYYSGQLFSRCLVFAGVVSTIMWLLINNTEFYKNIHSVTMIYLILIIGSVIICHRWFKRKYSVYVATAK